ncbi:hypothetical protein EB118_24905, partial [bacterium]|nr:hypothetical protein [bacterium]
TLATKTKSVASMFSKDGRTEIIETMQNYRYRVDRVNDILLRTKKLISFGPKQNSLGSALTLSSGKAESFYQKNFFVPISEANDMLADLAKSMNSNATDVLSLLHLYVIHKHDPERRAVKYLREVPLVNNDAITEREKILKEVIEIDVGALGEAAAKKKAEGLRKRLEAHVKATKVEGLALSDINNEAYNTLGPYNIKEIEAFGKAFKGENKVKADLLLKKLIEIENKTIELNKKANYFSPPVQNLVNFYGFENYFPFSGRPESGPNDYKMDVFGANVSGDLQDKTQAFDGRITDSDNPILNVLSEASKSAMRLGRHEAGVTLSIKNLIDSKIIKGNLKTTVTFEQRFNDKLNQELKRGARNIFHYLPDGKIEIYEIEDDNMLLAIKRPFKENNWFIDSVGKTTSFFGQMHTRFNPAFAPMDFARNLFTYAGVLGAETSGKRGLQVIGEMS